MTTSALARFSSLPLTRLGLGGAQAGNFAGARTTGEVAATFDAAWNGGIRYFDTAPHYGLGLSERRLGAWLTQHPRTDYVLSTKVGRLLLPSPETAGADDTAAGFAVPADHRRVWDLSRDGIRRSIADSLERLGMDRIDIAYVHDPEDRMEQALAEALPALAELRDEGVVGAIGAGMNYSGHLARLVTEADLDIVLCAGRYTLLDQSALADLLPTAIARSVAVVIGGVYNSGLLAQDRPPADATFDYHPASQSMLARARTIATVCEHHGVTLPEAALAFVGAHPAVISTLVGVRTPSEVHDTVARASAAIPPALWEDLRAGALIDPTAPVPQPTTPG